MKRTTNVAEVVVIPLVVLGLVVWFSISDPSAHAGPETACAHVEPCSHNICCGDISSSTAGGCTGKGCCEGTDYYCESSESRTPRNFPKVRVDGSGCCLIAEQSPIPYCEELGCEGGTLCSEGNCTEIAWSPTVISIHPPKCGVPCPSQPQ